MTIQEALKECKIRYPLGTKFIPLINLDKAGKGYLISIEEPFIAENNRINCITKGLGKWTIWTKELGFAKLYSDITEIKDIPQSIKEML